MSDTNPVGDFSVTDPGAPASMGTVEALFKHMRDWVRAEMTNPHPTQRPIRRPIRSRALSRNTPMADTFINRPIIIRTG